MPVAPRPRVLARTTDRLLLCYMSAVLSATAVVLALHWHDDYSQPLRQWLLVNAALTTLRTSGRIAMHAFPPDRLHTLRRVLAWVFRVLTLASLAWFIVGIHFLKQEDESVHSAVHVLVTALIAFELVVLGLSILIAIVIFLFALHPVLSALHGGPAATKEDLSKLRMFKFGEEAVLDGGNDTEFACSICLCDYQTDDLLRELPCAVGRHVFHAECVDEWLTQKLSCPICRDDPLGRSEASQQQAEQRDAHESDPESQV